MSRRVSLVATAPCLSVGPAWRRAAATALHNTNTRRPVLPSPNAAATTTMASRFLSSGEMLTEEERWNRTMTDKYGAGSYQLFRPLYKDLCDELRREFYTKPPPPPLRPAGPHRGAASTVSAVHMESSASKKGEEGKGVHATHERAAAPEENSSSSTTTASPPPQAPAITYGDGTWEVHHRPEINVIAFHRAAVQEGRLAEVHAWSTIELKDPPRLNAVLTFADWIPVEVCVVRNGVVVHFSMVANEGGMHMRNVRVYAATSAAELATLVDPSADGERARKALCYDGPCLWHLELDFLNELYDVMQDHGVTLDWMHWAASWVFYLEHVNYLRWNLGMLEELIPEAVRGPEGDFLSSAEQALLDEPVEDWLQAHGM